MLLPRLLAACVLISLVTSTREHEETWSRPLHILQTTLEAPCPLSPFPQVLRATALEEGTPPRAALEVFLNKEALIRHLYRGELLWLVGVVQARALGRRVAHPELFGIDWGQIDAQGNALKAELLSEVVQVGAEREGDGVGGGGTCPSFFGGL